MRGALVSFHAEVLQRRSRSCARVRLSRQPFTATCANHASSFAHLLHSLSNDFDDCGSFRMSE
jgi:hypothetical protein